MRRLQFVLLALVTMGLTACGGGGSSGGGTTTISGSQDYSFFTSTAGGATTLKAFDPATNTITTIPTTSLLYETGVHDGTLDPTTLTTSNLHLSDVLFEDNGSYYSVSAAQSDKLAVTQRSTYAGTVCDQSQDNNYLVVIDAGSNGTCSDSDDLVYAVTDKMASTDAPILLPARPSVVLFSDYSTASGLLYINGSGSLVYADASGQNPQTLLAGVSSVSEMNTVGNSVLLNIDGKVEIFDKTAKSLSSAFYTTSGSLSRALSDGTNFYFFDGQSLIAIPVDGSSGAMLVDTVAAASDINIGLIHNHYLVYYTYDSGTSVRTIDSIDLTMPLNVNGIKLLATATIPASISLEGYSGDYVYYNLSTGSSDVRGNAADAIKVDGSSPAISITDANWVGISYAQTINTAEGISVKYLVVDKYTTDGLGNPTGGNISVYDAATDTMISDQGALPGNITKFTGVGIGADIYGEFYDSTNSAYYLAHLNTTTSNSMKRLDLSTTPVTDSPIL